MLASSRDVCRGPRGEYASGILRRILARAWMLGPSLLLCIEPASKLIGLSRVHPPLKPRGFSYAFGAIEYSCLRIESIVSWNLAKPISQPIAIAMTELHPSDLPLTP